MWDWIAMHPAGSLALVAVLLMLAFLLLGWLLLPYVPTPPEQAPEQPKIIVWPAPTTHKTGWKDRPRDDRRPTNAS